MPNTSATGGYLSPVTINGELNDDALDDFLQGIVVGIVGLPGSMVRPRWQPEPPNIPPFGTDWAAIGEMKSEPDWTAIAIHQPQGDGQDSLYRQELLEIMVSFYGPHRRANANLMSLGFQVSQNLEQMEQKGYGLVDVGELLTTSDLVHERWLPRTDLTFRLRRAQLYTYPVENLLGIQAAIISDQQPQNSPVSANAFSGAKLPFFSWSFENSVMAGWNVGSWV